MSLVTQSLNVEHQELLPHIEPLCTAADAVGDLSLDDLDPTLEAADKVLASSNLKVLHLLMEKAVQHGISEKFAVV